VQSPCGKESDDGISSGEPRGYRGHLELDVCSQESHQGGDVGALERVNVSVKDLSELGLDRIEDRRVDRRPAPDAATEARTAVTGFRSSNSSASCQAMVGIP
jgi:hypothetical protein